MHPFKLPTYDAYQHSGVDWIGDIPAHWEKLAQKHVFRMRKVLVGKRSSEYELLSLTLRGVVKRDMENPEGKFPAEFDTYQEVAPGDFVFCHFDVEETPRTVGLSEHAGMITGAYTVYVPTPDCDPHYLLHFHVMADTNKKFRGLYKGLRNTISKEAFGSFKMPMPPREEQRAIAAFLNEKSLKIDDAIALEKRQIALLKERRQIVILNAVTKGLHPNAPMKDSGVDWIGEIPAHWEITKLGYLGRFQNGVSRSAEYFGKGFPFVTYGDVFNNSTVPSIPSGFAKSTKEDRILYSIKYGDIIFTRTSEVVSEIGISSVCLKGLDDATFSGFLIRFRPVSGKISPEYSSYVFRSQYVRDYFAHETNIVIRASLSQDLLRSLPVFVPPIEEQKKLTAYIQLEAGKIDRAIGAKNAQIALMREYKATLINIAVTGKIKVA